MPARGSPGTERPLVRTRMTQDKDGGPAEPNETQPNQRELSDDCFGPRRASPTMQLSSWSKYGSCLSNPHLLVPNFSAFASGGAVKTCDFMVFLEKVIRIHEDLRITEKNLLLRSGVRASA